MSDTEQCDRCNNGTAMSVMSLSAISGSSMASEYQLCSECVLALGVWYDNPDIEQ